MASIHHHSKCSDVCMVVELNSSDYKGEFLPINFRSNREVLNIAKKSEKRAHNKKRQTLWVGNKGNLRKKSMPSLVFDR